MTGNREIVKHQQTYTVHVETAGAMAGLEQDAASILAHQLQRVADKVDGNENLLRGLDLSIGSGMAHFLLNSLTMRLKQTVLAAGEHQEVLRIFVPDSWWDHWKQDHAPNWFCRWCPVQMHTVERTVTKFDRVCPHVHASDFGTNDPHLKFLVETGHDWRIRNVPPCVCAPEKGVRDV